MFFLVDSAHHQHTSMSKHLTAIHAAVELVFCFRLILWQLQEFLLQRINLLPHHLRHCNRKPLTVGYVHTVTSRPETRMLMALAVPANVEMKSPGLST